MNCLIPFSFSISQGGNTACYPGSNVKISSIVLGEKMQCYFKNTFFFFAEAIFELGFLFS